MYFHHVDRYWRFHTHLSAAKEVVRLTVHCLDEKVDFAAVRQILAVNDFYLERCVRAVEGVDYFETEGHDEEVSALDRDHRDEEICWVDMIGRASS